MGLSAGAAILWQSRLKDIESPYPGEEGSLAVGSKVPLEWTPANVIAGTTPVAQVTFGLVVDLFTWQFPGLRSRRHSAAPAPGARTQAGSDR
jgi:hypothetical protein